MLGSCVEWKLLCQWVTRVLTNNDTLGRLGYQLGLGQQARFSGSDARNVVDSWKPSETSRPPKALADLFEAYVGAVYKEKGWIATFSWLKCLFQPLLLAATNDFSRDEPRVPDSWIRAEFYDEYPLAHDSLSEYLKGHPLIVDDAQESLQALPPSSIFFFNRTGHLANDCEKVEVATHLIDLWICRIFTEDNPGITGPGLVSVRFAFICRALY